jgi:ATP-dependent Lon protease
LNEMPAKRISRSQAKPALPVLPVRDAVHFPNLINTLLVGRDMSLKALHAAMDETRKLIVLTQKDVAVEEPAPGDMHDIGVLSEGLQVLQLPDGTMRVVLRGLSRVRVDRLTIKDGYYRAETTPIVETKAKGAEADALMREALRVFEEVMELGRQIPVEAMQMAVHIEDAGSLADTIAHHLPIRPSAKQEILAEPSSLLRLKTLLGILNRERDVLSLQSDIRGQVEKELGDTQREYYLREQLKIIQQELNDRDERGGEIEEYAAKIAEAGMPPDVEEKAQHELRRLERAPAASPEGMVIRTYLDWMTSLPWQTLSSDALNVRHAKRILDRDHFGLEKVKDRVLDFLAVRQVSQSLRGPILCFVGPPGVGKTSIGKSIAEAMGRRFVRISLGGVRDEAEIRGHRRTYIGSLPGRIIQGIKSCETRNPVFMLDEIDKLGMDFRGDPTSALLEALDPEQNDKFTDHYIEAPFDLSAVMFITTANLLENIPWPLRDRMEVIQFPSYTEEEKVAIAKSFLVPKKVEEHGLKSSQLNIGESHLRAIVREYTREAGVRNLDREIATICRKTARQIAEKKTARVSMTLPMLHSFLGSPRYKHGAKEARDEIGAATGLVYTEFGGDVVTIEVSLTASRTLEEHLTLTGQLGDVMKESAQAAVTCVRSRAEKMGIQNGTAPARDAHIHVPAGAVPKDGPSAGITIAAAFASAISGRPVRSDVAMTGEITLRGKVLAIGGLREKVLAAHRAGIRNVIVPSENAKDLDEVPKAVLREIKIHPVRTIDEVLRIALK